VWAPAHAPSQYFPVLLRPSGWAGLFFFWPVIIPNPNPNLLLNISWPTYHITAACRPVASYAPARSLDGLDWSSRIA